MSIGKLLAPPSVPRSVARYEDAATTVTNEAVTASARTVPPAVSRRKGTLEIFEVTVVAVSIVTARVELRLPKARDIRAGHAVRSRICGTFRAAIRKREIMVHR
jgi:hypothetical protein